MSCVETTELRVEEAVLNLLIDPKPLKSGTSPAPGVAGFSESMVEICAGVFLDSKEDAEGVIVTGGELTRLALVVFRERARFAGVDAADCFSGEMDRARSKQ